MCVEFGHGVKEVSYVDSSKKTTYSQKNVACSQIVLYFTIFVSYNVNLVHNIRY